MNKNLFLVVAAGILYIFILFWGFSSEGTWDDDCPTRYYNVKHAIDEPREFVRVWNRPLFTLLYFLPMQLGKWTIVLETGLIAVLAGYFLALAANELKIKNAWLALPFTVMQTFYFPISFNALAEPLAVLCVALGIYFYAKKNWPGFVIASSLLPLARLEMSPLLLLWAFVLFRERQWKLILVLGIPTILWSLAGTYFDGDWFWLFNQVFTGQENRYGHGNFWDYPQRYIYVLGPVVFYFFMLGFFERIRSRKADFVLLSFVLGFLIYIYFSTWGNLGHAAGFLRNLIPLAPFAALLALEGFNLWQEHTEVSIMRVLIYSGAVIVLTLFFFSYTLFSHHSISNKPEYIKLVIVTSLTLIFLFRKNLLYKVKDSSIVALIVVALGLYTLITEPIIGLTPEREVMKEIAKWYKQNESLLKDRKVYVNHIWFFYAGDFDCFDTGKFGEVKVKELDNARKGDLVIWETHYSHRLSGDVQPEYFVDNKSFKQIGGLVTNDKSFTAIVLKKQ